MEHTLSLFITDKEKKIRKNKESKSKYRGFINHIVQKSETMVNLYKKRRKKRVWRRKFTDWFSFSGFNLDAKVCDKCDLQDVCSGLHDCCGTAEQQFIEGTVNANMYWDVLKQSMILSPWKLGRAGQCFNVIT